MVLGVVVAASEPDAAVRAERDALHVLAGVVRLVLELHRDRLVIGAHGEDLAVAELAHTPARAAGWS